MDLEMEIRFTSEFGATEIIKSVFVEYSFYGSYEAPSFDSEGCEPELEFEIYDGETGKVLAGFIVDQVEDDVIDQIMKDHAKECDSAAADAYYT